MRNMAIGLILTCLVFTAACAGGPGATGTTGGKLESTPDSYDLTGFRDIPWLADVSTVAGLTPSHQAGNIDIYVRPGDCLTVNNMRFEKVFYGFFADRFCAAAVPFEQPGAADVLYERVKTVFGEPDGNFETPEGEQVYIWDDVLVEVTLAQKDGQGMLKYRYKPLFKEIGEL